MAIDRPDDESEFGIADCVEHAFLEIEHSLRIGVVVQQTDQEVQPQRQRARARVRRVAKLGDDLLDLRARVASLQQGRSVDNNGRRSSSRRPHPRHIIDRRCRTGLSHIFTTFLLCVFSIAAASKNGRATYHYIRRRCGNFVLTPVSFFANVARKYGTFEEGDPMNSAAGDIAAAFVNARRNWKILPEYPGERPSDLRSAYVIQMQRWPIARPAGGRSAKSIRR